MATLAKLALVLSVAFGAGAASSAFAGDAALGGIISKPCTVCHGEGGGEPIDGNPVLAGQHYEYLLQVMREYKSGARADAVMGAQLQTFSDADLRNLAAYYAAQQSNLR